MEITYLLHLCRLKSLQDSGTLPRARTLGKGPVSSRQSLCRAPARQRPLGIVLIGKGCLCRAPRGRLSAKAFREPRQHSAKADGRRKGALVDGYLPSATMAGARQRLFIFLKKNSLLRALLAGSRQRLFICLFGKNLCRVPYRLALGKEYLFIFLNISLPSAW